MKLILPLRNYDEAGRIKPPFSFWLVLLFICRAYLVFIGSISYRQDSSLLLNMFYPDRQYFYASLIVAIPAFLVFLLCGFREKLWKIRINWFARLLKPLLFISISTDMVLHIIIAKQQYWQFSWPVAGTVILYTGVLYYLITSKHLSYMVRDWLA